jgi:carbon storage regulator CsrA
MRGLSYLLWERSSTMLVLSRQSGQEILFPNLGIRVHVLGTQGRTVRIGIDAPPDIKVLRAELPEAQTGVDQPRGKGLLHRLRNQLNRIGLGVQLGQRQFAAGRAEAADATLEQVLESLEALDRELFQARTPEPPAAPGKVRTLLVEDDTNERELLAGLLNLSGFDCRTAADGLDALDYLGSHDRPDLVLLDLRMPRCGGPETLAAIRRDPRLAGLKVFAVSGTAPEELGIARGPDGLDGWFPKPVDVRKLLAAIHASRDAAPKAN